MAMAGVLAIRRTLVLGLGTTGREVAESLAEHLTWQFGGMDRVAWVRLLVLETEQPASPLGDRVLWSGMKPEEYSQYITQPRTAGADFGFFDWQDGPTLSRISNPATGAGNLRMLGRLTLFHPRTYHNLRTRVSRDIGELNQLTPQVVADKLGEPGLNVNIHSDTVVYVVGTLCGGTCSGGAADLGYLLDVWSNGSINRQAIFTVAHPGLGRVEAPRYKKNSYYALRELNHYQLSENPWVQRLPGFGAPVVRNNVPYDILRVVMPGGPTGEDVQRLNAMIGQYLAAAVGPAGAEIAANDVNALNKMASTENIGFMRPLFSTMGVAALEYPGEHIQRGATSRLLSTTLQRWCRHRVDSELFDNALRLLGGADFDSILQKLTQGAENISVATFQDMVRLGQEGAPPRVEQVRQLIREVDGRLEAMNLPQGESSVASALPTLLQVMQNNHDAFLQRVEQDIARFVEQSLFTLDGGPGFVAEALKQYMSRMEAWAATAQTNLPETQQDARSLRDILDHHLNELESTQKSLMPFGKKEKLKNGWEAVTTGLRAYMEAEVKTQALNHLQRRDLIREMLEQYRRVTTTRIRRLEQMQSAFLQEASELEKQAKDMAASSPSVNGRVYFDAEPPSPRGTVTEEYFNLLRQVRWPDEPSTGWDDAKKEEAAQREVVKTLAPLAQELTRDDGASAFDSRPGIQSAREMLPTQVMDTAEARARTFFAPLRHQTHIADKASDADINTVILLSEPKLGVSGTQVSDQLAGVRGVTPAQQDLAFTDVETGGGVNRPSVDALTEKIRNSMTLQRGQITDSDDSFRLLLIREKHGFTFGQMEGIVRANAHDLTALQSSEYCADFHFWHTRRDVDWVDPLVPPGRVETTEEAWLLAVLLGRQADGMLAWSPSNMKEIEPEGWYTITNGEFRVFYPAGMLDVSDRDARLPLSFPEAVAKLLTPEYAPLKRALNMRFNAYRDKAGDDRVVRVLDQALNALDIFGMTGIERQRADRIVRRAYRRNDSLTRAFFTFRTDNMEKGRAEFAHLRHIQGEPIVGKNSVYPADGYYCPDCNHPLGAEVQQLLDSMFLCPACNRDERYWP
jgi:hypothetical protein